MRKRRVKKAILSIILSMAWMLTMISLDVFSLKAYATSTPENVINGDTTWYIMKRDSGGYKWVSKPTDDDTAQPRDVSIVSVQFAGNFNAPATLNNGAKLTIKLPKALPKGPMASPAPEQILSLRDGDSSGGSVHIVESEETFSDTSDGALDLYINGADGSDNDNGYGGEGDAAVKLSGGLTIDNKLWEIKICGGKGGRGSAGGAGGIGVDGALTVAGGNVEITGGDGGDGISDGGAGGTGVHGDVMLTDGTLRVSGGDGSDESADGAGGAGVNGTVTLAGGTLIVVGGDGGGTLGQAPAFADGSKVIIQSGFAYTDGTKVYPAGTYKTEGDFNLNDAFGGKILRLCEARIGDKFYCTLNDAFGKASDGDKITLLRDVEQRSMLDFKATSLSLDLNGKELLFINNYGSSFYENGSIRYFKYDDDHMLTIAGSGTIEAQGPDQGGNAIIPLWRFCHDAAGTGTLTILDDVVMADYENIGNLPWAVFRNNITTAVLNEGVTKVGDFAFVGCINLKTVTIPATVTEITEDSMGYTPFDGCPKLEKINVAAGNSMYSNNNGDGVLYTKDKTTLIFCPRGKTGTFTVPAEVTTLKAYSFNNSDMYDSKMSLSRIGFARTEAGTLSMKKAFDSYAGDCVLVAPDGLLIEHKSQISASFNMSSTEIISFRAVTAWDRLQDELDEGGTVKLTRNYDYTQDSYEVKNWGIISYYGALIVPEGTVLDLNGYTLTADGFFGDGESTVKGGILNCNILTNYVMGSGSGISDPTYGTLTLDNATVTVAQKMYWYGGMVFKGSTMTVDGSNNTGSMGDDIAWMAPKSGAMLTMDAASSLTLPQKNVDDSKWILMNFSTEEDAEYAAGQLGFIPVGWTFGIVSGKTNNGESEVTYYALSVKNAEAEFPASVKFQRTEGVPATVTAITGNYDGKEKALVSVDNSTLFGGTMYYAVTTENTAPEDSFYTTSIPKATDAGTYYVWYKVVGDSCHKDTEAGCVQVTIAKAEVTAPSVASKAYTGQKQTATVAANSLYEVTTNAGGTNVGSYDVVLALKDADNYKWSDSDKATKTLAFQITQATTNTVTVDITGWTYGEDASAPTSTATFGTATYTYAAKGSNQFSATVPSNAGMLRKAYKEGKTTKYTDGLQYVEYRLDVENNPNSCRDFYDIDIDEGQIILVNRVTTKAFPETGGEISESRSYKDGDKVVLKARSSYGYGFKGWFEGDRMVSSTNNYEFQVYDNRELTAKFEYILDGQRGDFNGDGQVNRADRIYLARGLAGWKGYSIDDYAIADINKDGVVNRADRMFFARALASWGIQ